MSSEARTRTATGRPSSLGQLGWRAWYVSEELLRPPVIPCAFLIILATSIACWLALRSPEGHCSGTGSNSTALRVACVGDSITFGFAASDRCGTSYPAQMQSLLGPAYSVRNFGSSGRTMLKQGDTPYWCDLVYTEALESAADLVVLMLGTNDARPSNWPEHHAQFALDYADMIASLKRSLPCAVILLMIPPPLYVYSPHAINQTVINSQMPMLIHTLAAGTHLVPPIDLNQLFQRHCPVSIGSTVDCEWISDRIHPTDLGYAAIAAAVAHAVKASAVPLPSPCESPLLSSSQASCTVCSAFTHAQLASTNCGVDEWVLLVLILACSAVRLGCVALMYYYYHRCCRF